jgi:hypothetical protein
MKKIAVIASILAVGGCSGGSTPQNWICEGEGSQITSSGDVWDGKFISSIQIKDQKLSMDGTVIAMSRSLPLTQKCEPALEKKNFETACIYNGSLVYHYRSEFLGLTDLYLNLSTGLYKYYHAHRVPAVEGAPSFGVQHSSNGTCRPINN